MTNILINSSNSERIDGCTLDSIKYKKDCIDFECLEDGTLTRECKYCNLSLDCRQVGFIDGKFFPMESHYLPLRDAVSDKIIEWEFFCTGNYDYRSLDERKQDDIVS